MGYKIYFDGEKFVKEGNVPAEDVTADECVSWYAYLEDANEVVDTRNKRLKSKPEDLVELYDFLVKRCECCGKYFRLRRNEVKAYIDKNLNMPHKCSECRKLENKKE